MTKAGAGSGPNVEDGATANPEELGCYSGIIPQLALFSIPLMTLHPQTMGSVLPGRGVPEQIPRELSDPPWFWSPESIC